MNDLISRQDAIDVFDGVKVDERDCTEYDIGYNDGIDFAISKLSVLPYAQKKGEWEEIEVIADVHDTNGVKTWASKMMCDQCGFTTIAIEGHFSQYNFCPNCGADMRRDKE